jgi:BASS family bile acid:Na+ symporter
LIAPLAAALATAARYGTWLMAGGLVAGFAAPALAGTFRPWLLHAIVVILAVAMLRLDVARIRAFSRRPLAIAAIVAVNLVASPLVAWAVLQAVPAPVPIVQGVVLMAAAPMVTSAIAIAAILGLDSALAVCVLVASYAIVPVTLPALSLWLIGLDLGVGFVELFSRLFSTIALPAAIAFVLRRWVLAPGSLARHGRAIDGIGIVAIALFCVGIMDGLRDFVVERPDTALATLGAAVAANVGLQAFGALVFLRLGRREALTVGLITGNSNLGLILVTLGDKASPELVAFFVLGQVPMYFLPVFALPLYRRLLPP